MSDMHAKEITILRVGAAGGHLEVVGAKDHSGWKFQVRTDESTLVGLLTDEDAAGLSPRTAGPWVRSWDEALDQLQTRYPHWRRLDPLHVEPAFRNQIVAGFLGVRYNDTDSVQSNLREILRRWVILLLDVQASPSRGRQAGGFAGRTLGEHPVEGGLIIANTGRFGPYVRHNRLYAKIPADKTLDTITLEEAVSLLNARAKTLRRLRLRRPQKNVGRAPGPRLRPRRQ